jgi:hypothetical protein
MLMIPVWGIIACIEKVGCTAGTIGNLLHRYSPHKFSIHYH